ncbi:uncharacterized protein TNCV_2048201 [Trichonephila clavipes]|nr:uncharacterized protein TNCV_2048201 [Trichonephila clavipes]
MLDKTTDIADRILEASPSLIETFVISNRKGLTLEPKLSREIEKLNERIGRLSISRSRSPYRWNKNSHESRNPNNRDFSICWFHGRFGKISKAENAFTHAHGREMNVRKLSKTLKWNEKAEQAFLVAKKAMAESTLLKHPISEAEVSLWVDASDIANGGTLL